MAQHDRYISPFSTRYASDEMQYIFSDDNKFRTWRKLWIALAKAEQKQGLAITDEQIAELEAHKDDVNYEDAIAREKLVRHDVMSHVYAYGLQCPKAKGIIHLGATSCYVGDNTDVIIMREALQLVRKKIIGVLANLAKFADEYKDMPCLAYTHCQPAQLTTVGKRATLWMNELYMDLEEVDHQIGQLALRGVKGTTGTQASFMELFGGDSAKIKAVEADVCAQMGFTKVVPVCGQTYSRKVDYNVLSAVAGIGQSAMKMATDIRLLANFKEMEEPFEKNQIGSSAMPYKRNPMRCERICALSRYLMVDVLNPAITAGTQWFERTLDDSANKRIAMAEGFLAADAILNILLMLLAVSAYIAVFSYAPEGGTSLLNALSTWLVGSVPEFLLRYSGVIFIILAVIIVRLVPYQMYMAMFPMIASVGLAFDISAVAMIAPLAVVMGMGSAVSPMTATTYVSTAVAEVDIMELGKRGVIYMEVGVIVALIFGTVFGLLPV